MLRCRPVALLAAALLGVGLCVAGTGAASAVTAKAAAIPRVAVPKVTPAAAAAVAAPPAIQGSVTKAGTTTGVAGVVVSAAIVGDFEQDAPFVTTTTAANGSYTLVGLAAGTAYTVCFDPSHASAAPATGYLATCYGLGVGTGPTDVNPGTYVTPGANAVVTGIDAQLAVGSAVTGEVTALAGGAGLAGVVVRVFSIATGQMVTTPLANPEVIPPQVTPAAAVTSATGTYTLKGLPASDGYGICFDASHATGGSSATGYQNQCDHDVNWPDIQYLPLAVAAQPLAAAVTAGPINAALPAGGVITGAVTAKTGGAGLGGVLVYVYPLSGDADVSTIVATTAASGTYRVTGLRPVSGGYGVCFGATHATGGTSSTGYLSQCYRGVVWDGIAAPGALPAVTVTAGATTGSISAALSPAGAITGTVTASGAPLAGVTVEVFDGSREVSAVTTSSSGTYRLTGVPPAPTVPFSSGDWVCFDATRVTGGAGAAAAAGTAAGAAGVNYVDQCYRGFNWDPPGAPEFYEATQVTVTAGATTTGIDAALAVAGTVSGKVTAAVGGAGLGNVKVQVVNSGGTSYASTYTQPDGAYTVRGLAAGHYSVCFGASGSVRGASSTGYLSQCYKNIPWSGGPFAPPAATLVAVTAGTTTTGINAALAVAGGISGKVTAAVGAGVSSGRASISGGGLAGIAVSVFNPSTGTTVGSAVTGPDGTYDVTGLAASASGYQVCFDAVGLIGPATTGYIDQCYRGTAWGGPSDAAPSTATLVPVQLGATSSAINAVLVAGGVIAGKVTATGGAALPGVTVEIYNGVTLIGQATTADDGTYRVPRLTASSGDDVCFTLSPGLFGPSPLPAGGYLSQCYKGIAWNGYSLPAPAKSTTVRVTAGVVIAGVNAALPPAAGISGRVTAATGGAGLPNIGVDVIDSAGNVVGGADTANDGSYSITGLVPSANGYHVCFDTGIPAGTRAIGYYDQCYAGQSWTGSTFSLPTHATAVPALAGVATTGVNAALTTAKPPQIGSISGTITTAGGAPLGGASVTAFQDQGGFSPADPIGYATTAADGTYTITGLPVSSAGYAVCVEAPRPSVGSAGYLDRCYRLVPWDGFEDIPAGVTKVPVAGGTTTTGINMALPVAGGISGKVTAAVGGAGIGNVEVEWFDSAGHFVGDEYTAADGSYTVTGVTPSVSGYIVAFRGQFAGGGGTTGYTSQCYKGIAWDGNSSDVPVTLATKVVVKAGVITSAVNAVLAANPPK